MIMAEPGNTSLPLITASIRELELLSAGTSVKGASIGNRVGGARRMAWLELRVHTDIRREGAARMTL